VISRGSFPIAGQWRGRIVWRDYLGLIPSTAAIINGFIAVLVAQFYKDRPTAKIILLVFAGALGFAAIVATFCSQHEVLSAQAAEKAHRAEVRQAIGKFIEKGNVLKRRCEHISSPIPLDDANAWKGRVEQYLHKELDDSFVIRFRDRSGILQSEMLSKGDDAHVGMWSAFYYFVTRLEQFSQELPY
jgi:hypothetical protein